MRYYMYFAATIVCIGVLVASVWTWQRVYAPTSPRAIDPVACPADARVCPDGSTVSRQGQGCRFASCPSRPVSADVKESMSELSRQIELPVPAAGSYVVSPLRFSGKARGNWFFEGSFPFSIVDWDGRVIASGTVTATEDWMTDTFVSFAATTSFSAPVRADDPEYMQRGAIILQKANPSGRPQSSAALEVPIWFRPAAD